jgi:maleamate amidohydrolase
MFGWENFLSERDKKHDELWGKKELYGFGKKPALVLIDLYYSVLGTVREPIFESMKMWPLSTGLEGWAAIDRTVGLIASAREHGIPVIHVKGLHTGVDHWVKYKKKSNTNPAMSPELRQRGTEIVDEVKPLAGELVIEKAAASAFHGTPLAFHLTSLGIDTIILAGETTSGCIRASVVDGCTNRYRMGVVAECVFDRTESSHYLNLYDIHNKYADVVHLDYAKDYFKQIGAMQKESIRV